MYFQYKMCCLYIENNRSNFWDFPGGAVVGNPPGSAGDIGSIPGLGRSHIAIEQLSLHATTTEPTCRNY